MSDAIPDFDADTALVPRGAHRYGTTLLDDSARGLRSITVHYLARPEFDAVEIAVDIIRAGRSLSTVQATMTQGDRLICSSIAAFSVPWESAETWSLPLSDHAHDESIVGDGPRPPVHQNWSGRPIVDAPFFSGEGSSRVGQWIRAVKPRELDAIELVAIADAIPPAGFPRMTQGAAMPTVDLTVHIRASLPLVDPPTDDRVYAECNTHHVADGFADDDCHIWSADGRLLAQSRQLAITR